MDETRAANDSLKRLNCSLEDRLTDQMIAKRTTDNVELVELRRTMLECEMELHELREQYVTLKTKAENDLCKEHKKIDELTQIVQNEMERNTSLSKDLQALRNATVAIESIQNGIIHEDRANKCSESHNVAEAAAAPAIATKPQNSVRIEVSTNPEDLTELLNEAKSTILQLQEETKTLKTEIETLRHQNQNHSKQIETLLDCNNAKVPASAVEPPPIPLEPIVIVKDNSGQNDSKCSQKVNAKIDQNDRVANLNYEMDTCEKSATSNQSSQSDNICLVFVI